MAAFDWKSYYRTNKTKILAKRRTRYAADADFAARSRKSSADYRARQREANPEQGPRRRNRRPVKITVRGTEMVGWTIGFFAKAVGRKVPTILHWERVGLLPETPIRTPAGDRLYTDEMAEVVRAALEPRGQVSKKDSTFCKEIENGWRRIGVL